MAIDLLLSNQKVPDALNLENLKGELFCSDFLNAQEQATGTGVESCRTANALIQCIA